MSEESSSAVRPAAFALGYLAAFFLSSVIAVPLVWYYPVERRFAFEAHPTGLASDFYGRVLLSVAAGGIFAVLARPGWTGPRARTLLPLWIATLLLFTAGLYAFVLAHRLVIPAPLPPGYVPR